MAREGDQIKVWVTAPPADGQANEAVVKVVSKALGVAPSRLSIIRGESSREKVLRVEGLAEPDIRKRLAS